MIKGACKQMIVVRTGDSRFFDEAYFVLRKELGDGDKDRDALLKEANRLLDEHIAHSARKSRKAALYCFLFIAGILCGAITAIPFCILLF